MRALQVPQKKSYQYIQEYVKNKKLTKVQKVFLIYQIIEGMKYIHYEKIIYRDLKPTNILMATDGTIKIADFGVAKLMSAEEQAKTQGIGTQKFMAPEIIDGEEYNEKVDVFALGAILYEIITGAGIVFLFFYAGRSLYAAVR